MTPAKPFQKATVSAVLKALKTSFAKRFLIADEVGLGKTVVAQHVIRRLMDGRTEPLTVFYVCSNLSIASQNRRKLLEVLPAAEREAATCNVDRLTLLPAEDLPTHPGLRLFTLTPDTSIPIRKGKRRDGRQEERALIQALLERTWPSVKDELGPYFFKRRAYAWWTTLLAWQREKAASTKLQEGFRRAVRREFDLNEGEWLGPKLRELDELDVIARFRNALAACAIDDMAPDLVIFDEFQKFRDLLNEPETEAAGRVIKRLRGDSGSASLILLSATPYKPFSTRWEEAAGLSHHREFLDLIEFLYGGGTAAKEKRRRAQDAFSALAKELHKGRIDSSEAGAAREAIEQLLRPVMSRTERYLQKDAWAHHETTLIQAPISPADLQIYKHWASSLSPGDASGAVPYWTSIPLPMQTMGARYVVWDRASGAAEVTAPEFTQTERDAYGRLASWPHPRLRALAKEVPVELLGLPWMPPTLPWWKLKGPWSSPKAQRGKVLIFSRFRAVPQTIAATLSYELEASALRGGGMDYGDISKRRLLQATGERYALLAYFHPSPTLAGLCDPLETPGDPNAVRAAAKRKIRKFFDKAGIEIRPGPARPLWQLIARLEAYAGHWPWMSRLWWDMYKANARRPATSTAVEENRAGGLGKLLERWDDEASRGLQHVTPEEIDALSGHALSAPGVVLGRAICRFWPGALNEEGFAHSLRASWNGLRTYFDQRWFMRALGGDERNYPRLLQRAALDGNLEAVLDEYFWLISKLNGLEGKELAEEILTALQLHNSESIFHGLNDKRKRFALRSHAALPFIEAKQVSYEGEDPVEKPLRVDEMRKAFNSPFYPHVLATTSVGQEGLDFHAWCSTVIHWDLGTNPVDIEQREGRIQRFAGLSVRRELKKRLGTNVFRGLKSGFSPWKAMEGLAESKLADASGLAPWWVCPGAKVERMVFDVPASEQRERLAWMKEQRLLYRLVLGQPNQEDLIEVLSRSGTVDLSKVFDALPRLSAWTDSNH